MVLKFQSVFQSETPSEEAFSKAPQGENYYETIYPPDSSSSFRFRGFPKFLIYLNFLISASGKLFQER